MIAEGLDFIPEFLRRNGWSDKIEEATKIAVEQGRDAFFRYFLRESGGTDE